MPEPLTAETVTDEQIRAEVSELETEIAILEAALKISRGPLVFQIRKSAAEIINARSKAEGK